MAKYEPGDIVTIYLVIMKRPNGKSGIQAWSMNKDMAQCYMKFHNCPNFKMKSFRGTIEEVNRLTEENINDEIGIFNIRTHNPDKPDSKKAVALPIPMTDTEYQHITSECSSFMANDINYSFMAEAYDYMKPEYQRLFRNILMYEVCQFVVHNKPSRILETIEFDQLLVLARSFPENFGE